ncbi:MAG: hypothetical protein HC911_17785, partial [Chloroflexaceae bacterium]|nr:hypothetical protein [Chloroflexaceae bacterium]
KLLGVMSEQERNYRIGRLVLSWRNGHLPAGQVSGDGGQAAGAGAGETDHDGHEDHEGAQVLGEAYAERDDAPIPDPYHLEPDTYDLPPDPYHPDPDTSPPAPDPAPPATLAELWACACEQVRLLVGAVAFERDLAEVRMVGLDENEITLACPSLAARDRLENTYLGQVRRVLSELLGVPDLCVHVMLYRP